MAEKTGISWTDATFNPWWGCAKVSPACDHCYAERDAGRFAPTMTLWGVDAQRREFDDKHWEQPLRWARRAFTECPACGWRGMHTKLRHDGGAHFCPSCGKDEWRMARMRVFCSSMADVFDKNAPAGARDRLWELIRATPQLDWLLLTKRIGNAYGMLPIDFNAERYPHVWLGATVVTQEEVDRDVPKLLGLNARVRFLSIEPMLGPIDLGLCDCDHGSVPSPYNSGGVSCPKCDGVGGRLVDWVICGGESGPKARPMHVEWVRGLRDQCADVGVPFHFKQWGEWTHTVAAHDEREPAVYMHEDGRTASEEQALADGGRWQGMYRLGKAAAGRLLDGVTHDAFPEASRQ